MKVGTGIRTFLIAIALMLSTNGRIEAQQPSAVQAADSAVLLEAASGTTESAVGAVAPTQGLPRRAPQPRTLHEFWPAFALLAALWVAMVVYVVPMRSPLRRIAERIAASENRTGGR